VQAPAEGVGGDDVEAAVADQGGSAGDRVEGVLQPGPHRGGAGGASLPPGRRGVGGAREVEHVVTFGVVEVEGVSDRVQDRVGYAGEVASLQPGVVLDADPRQHRDFRAAQAGHAAVAGGGHVDLVGTDLRPACGEKVADLVAVRHAHPARVGGTRRRVGFPASAPFSGDFPPGTVEGLIELCRARPSQEP
jgi:hypothetical protein